MKTVIVFIGLPGCGKGTQSQNLCTSFDIKSYSLGELLRSYAEASHSDSAEVKDLIEQGLIVPPHVVNKIVKDLLDKTSKVCLLDGYPRDIQQAEFLNSYDNLNVVAFYFHLDKSVLMDRILNRVQCKCGKIYSYSLHDFDNFKCNSCGSSEYYKRSDDNEKILHNRIEQFEINTVPVIDFYNKLGKLYEIDASEDIGKITDRLSLIISKLGIDFRR